MSTPKNEGEQQNKPATRYDQKLERRKKKAKEDARKDKVFNLACIGIGLLIIAAIAGLFATSSINRNKAVKDTYVKVGNHQITKLEYDYYYYMIVNNYVNSYGQMLPYMGLDVNADFAQQQYTDNMTWKDAFDEMTVNQIINVKAMNDDAGTNVFTVDINEDYSQFQENMATSAAANNVSEDRYYKMAFGSYATKENLEPFIKQNLTAEAYYNSLTDRFGPSEEEITAYYNENKNNYDKMTYRSFTFNSELAADATDEQKAEAAKQLKTRADEMAARRKAGEDFNTLCLEYAAEADKEKYQDAEVDSSLIEKDSYNYISADYREWLFDETRKPTEITVIESETGDAYYVVEFVERIEDETANDNIKQTLASEEVNEYIESLMTSYEVVDVAGDLVYLTIPETVAETTAVNESVTETVGPEAAEETATTAETTVQEATEPSSEATSAAESSAG